MKLWQKYLLFSLTKSFLFLVFCLFLLYVTVDLSIHGIKFLFLGKSSLLAVLSYYFFSFVEHLELFFGLAFLLAALRVLLSSQQAGELTALEMMGLSKKSILFPFFLFSAALFSLSLASSEWLSPWICKNTTSLKKFDVPNAKKPLYTLHLKDGSELVYQAFQRKEEKLFDVYWIRSFEEIWYIQELTLKGTSAKGKWVDRLLRNEKGFIEKKESFPLYTFEAFLEEETSIDRDLSLENQSLSSLFKELIFSQNNGSRAAYFHYKLAKSLLFFLIIIGIAKVSFSFSRTKKNFLIVAISLFLFVAFVTFLDAMLILAETGVFSPPLALWAPFLLFSLFTLPSFLKIR